MRQKLKNSFKIGTASFTILLLLLLLWGHFTEEGVGLPRLIMIPFLISVVWMLATIVAMCVWELVLRYREKGIKSVAWFIASMGLALGAFYLLDTFWLKRNLGFQSLLLSALSASVVAKAVDFIHRKS